MLDLPKHFSQTLRQLKVGEGEQEAWAEIERRHRDPQRHFHTLDYLAFRLALLAETDHDHPHLRLALCYQHSVHDPCGEDNELQSARFATEQLRSLGVAEKDRSPVYDLIRVVDPRPGPIPPQGDLFHDLHLAWLGSAADQFQQFAEKLRREHSWLPDSRYHRQRTHEVMPLLDQAVIYQTGEFRRRFEDQARANLIAEIIRLRS